MNGTTQTIKRSRVPTSRALRKWRRRSNASQIRMVQARLDEVAETWDDAAAEPTPFGRAGGRNLIFMHVPKTGGSTLDNIIPLNYDIDSIVHVNPPILRRHPGAIFKDGAFARVVLGHFRFNSIAYTLAEPPLAHLTMLREPIGRIISHYNFKLSKRHRGEPEVGGDDDFARYVASTDHVECHNGQVLRIAGMLDRRTIRDPAAVEDALEIAKENLARRFTIFGLTERYPEFLLMCQRLLGWSNIYATKRKVTRDTPGRVHRETLAPPTLERLRERNRADLAFYEFARRLNDQRIARLGITDEDVDEFRRRNAAFGELVQTPVGKRGREPGAGS